MGRRRPDGPHQGRLNHAMSGDGNELAGKVALITGASRGIGRGIALELASAGCDVMLAARNGKALEGVAQEIRALGRKAAIHAADLTAGAEPAGLIEALTRDFGRLDILVNNAGGTQTRRLFRADRAGLARRLRSEILRACALVPAGLAAVEGGARLGRLHRGHRRPRAGRRLHDRRLGGRRQPRLHEGARRSRQARRRPGQCGQSRLGRRPTASATGSTSS